MKPKSLLIILLVVITLAPLVGLIGQGITDAHDSVSHVVRVASFYQSLTEGNLVPRWSKTLDYGYGHPIFMFLYPLPNYAASLVHAVGFSVINSVKAVTGLSFALAGFFAYLWLKQLFGTWPALVGAAVFQLAPYRFVNLYVRNAFGENMATLFIPLVLWLITKLVRQPSRKYLVFTSLAWAGLFLSHNAISLMILPVLCIYVLVLLYSSPIKLKAICHMLCALMLALGLASFFWLPAFVEGKYTLRDIVTAGDAFAAHFPTLSQLIVPSWGYDVSAPGPNDGMSFQIGLIQWLAFLASSVVIIKAKFRRPLLIIGWLVFISSVLIMLPVSLPIWHIITVLGKFQFPWRFLTLSVVAAGLLAAGVAAKLQASRLLTVIVILLLVVQTIWYWHPKGFLPQTEQELISTYTGTTDTGESSPLWSVRFQEHPPEAPVMVVHGAPITYQIHRRDSQIHEYTITTTVPTQVSDSTLYFPGWTVYVDGHTTPITYTDPNWRGEITYLIPTGTHQIRVIFEDTRLRQAADLISLTSIAILLIKIIV